MNAKLASLFLFTVGVAATAANAQNKAADVPTFPSGTATALVPWSGNPDFDHLRSLLHVRASLNGGPAENFVIDTGSTGIVVAATSIKDFDGKGEPGSLTYSSSGISEIGVWKTIDVTFPDAISSDGKPVVSKVRVLAVTSVECSGKGVNAAKCSGDAPSAHMMGIGFGRGPGKVDAQENNPFVMVRKMNTGQMRRGYTLTAKGVQLGLTAETVGKGYLWQKLTPRDGVTVPDDYNGPKDWTTAAGSFSVANSKPMPMGVVLMDTGLTNMIIEAEGAPKEGDVPAGTPMRIYLLAGKLHYDFLVNDVANPTTPRKVSWRIPHGTYVNTGLRALTQYDYLYDADGGYLGLRPRGQVTTTEADKIPVDTTPTDKPAPAK